MPVYPASTPELRHGRGRGWVAFAANASVGTGAELVSTNAYTALTADDNVELLSSSAADTTQTATVWGLNSSNNFTFETIALLGTSVATSTTTFRVIDGIILSAKAAGTVTLRKASDNVTITTVVANRLEGLVAIHSLGAGYDAMLYGWRMSNESSTATGTQILEVRVFKPTTAFQSAFTTDFYRIEGGGLPTGFGNTSVNWGTNPIRVQGPAVIAVVVTAGAGSVTRSVALVGADVKTGGAS